MFILGANGPPASSHGPPSNSTSIKTHRSNYNEWVMQHDLLTTQNIRIKKEKKKSI